MNAVEVLATFWSLKTYFVFGFRIHSKSLFCGPILFPRIPVKFKVSNVVTGVIADGSLTKMSPRDFAELLLRFYGTSGVVPSVTVGASRRE